MAVVNELVSRFSFIGSLAPQQDFNKGLAQSITLLGGVTAAIAASAGGLFAFVASTTEAADKLTDINAETGVSVEALQEWGFAAELSGSSAEQMTASLSGLSKVAGDASRGLGRGKKAFDELGISVKDASGHVKTADVLFAELGNKFQTMGVDSARQKSIIASLGLDPSTLQLLNATGEEVDKLTAKARALGIVTTEQAEAAAEFQDSLGIAKFGMQALQQQVAVGLAPAFTDITNRFIGFLEVNHELIEDGLKYLGQVIISVMGFIERMAPLVLALGAAFLIAKVATIGFARVFAFVLSPVVLITAAIVAVLLVIDDLITAFKGGQSVIADFFMEFFGIDIVPILRGIVDGFKQMIADVMAILQPFFDAFGHLFDAVISAFKGNWSDALNSLLASFNSAGEGIKNILVAAFQFVLTAVGQIFGMMGEQGKAVFTGLVQVIGDLFAGVAKLFQGDFTGALDLLKSAFQGWIDIIKGLFGGLFDYLSQAWGGILSGIKAGASKILPDWAVKMVSSGETPTAVTQAREVGSPHEANDAMYQGDVPLITPNQAIGIGQQSNMSSNSSIEQQNQINVYSSDPNQAGVAVNNALQDQLKTAKTQVNRGGR